MAPILTFLLHLMAFKTFAERNGQRERLKYGLSPRSPREGIWSRLRLEGCVWEAEGLGVSLSVVLRSGRLQGPGGRDGKASGPGGWIRVSM